MFNYDKISDMNWIHDYQLFLFDFDGLLVNTEEIHFAAYRRMCAGRGFTLPWDFPRYCQAAHQDADALRDQIYAEFPDLQAIEPRWDVLYAEKKQAYIDLLNEGAVHLMPGAAKLLQALSEANINRCVVTHSPSELVSIIRKQNPLLNTIPHWVTRDTYSKPKPDPECYIKAIEMHAKENDRVIGFEDTPRGLRALMYTRAQPVLVCPLDHPGLPAMSNWPVLYFSSLENLAQIDSLSPN